MLVKVIYVCIYIYIYVIPLSGGALTSLATSLFFPGKTNSLKYN